MRPQKATIVLVSAERMLRGLIVGHLRAAAAEFDVIEAISLHEAAKNSIPPPAVLAFLDTALGGQELLKDIRHAREAFPEVTIAIIAQYHDRQIISQSLSLGVKGYISTLEGVDTLIHSLRMLLAGGGVMSPTVLADISKINEVPAEDARLPATNGRPLTERERQVLCLIRRGASNKAIANQLGTDEGSIKNHVRGLMRKIGARNRVELAVAKYEFTASNP